MSGDVPRREGKRSSEARARSLGTRRNRESRLPCLPHFFLPCVSPGGTPGPCAKRGARLPLFAHQGKAPKRTANLVRQSSGNRQGGGGRSSPSKHQEKRRLTRRRLCALPFLLKRRTPFPAPMFLKHGVLIPPHVPHRAGRARKAPRLLPPLRQHAPACRYARGWQKKAKGLPPRPAR